MMRMLSLLAVLAALAGLTLLCSDPAALAQDGGAWGDVKGQIVWAGDGLPELKFLKVEKDTEHCLSKGKIPGEDWVVNKDSKGIRWAVVWLIPDPPPDPDTNPDAKLAVHPKLQAVDKDKKHVVDQPCCKFEPHVTVMRQGETVVAKNSAPIAHNFKWAGIRNRGDNKLMPPNTSFDIADLKASPFPVIVECNIHEWMRAYIRVFDHPYFAVTDENGRFEIKNAPAGKCRIVVWQESIGYKNDKNGDAITIKPGAATDLGKIELKPK